MYNSICIVVLTVLAMLSAVGCQSEDTVEGTQGRALTLTAPEPVTLRRGEIVSVPLTIERTDLDQEVSVSFSQLPDGVSVVDEDKNIVGTEGTYRLQADDDADLVANHRAQVTVTAVDTEIAVSQPIEITVEQVE
jgi:hypothetical protein